MVAARHLETIHGTDWSSQASSCHCLISLSSSTLHWGWGKGSRYLQTWPQGAPECTYLVLSLFPALTAAGGLLFSIMPVGCATGGQQWAWSGQSWSMGLTLKAQLPESFASYSALMSLRTELTQPQKFITWLSAKMLRIGVNFIEKHKTGSWGSAAFVPATYPITYVSVDLLNTLTSFAA